MAVSTDGTVFVGDTGRIQEFNSTGTYLGEIPLPSGDAGTTQALGVDLLGNLYFAFSQNFSAQFPQKPNVYKHNSAGWSLFAELDFPKYIATDAANSVYVGIRRGQYLSDVLKFGSGGACLLCLDQHFAAPADNGIQGTPEMRALGIDEGCGPTDVYVAFNTNDEDFLNAYGVPPDTTICPPPPVPPSIKAEYAVGVGTREATLRAAINPRLWSDAKYYLQYGTDDCSKGGCVDRPAAPGTVLSQQVVNRPLITAGIMLTGLEPDTTYHYRFVTTSGGGGPVVGEDRTFTTLPPLRPLPNPDPCPNAEFRTGAGARLPDCRAYEMVSPLDKGNGDASVPGEAPRRNLLNQSSVDGNAFTFSTYQAFAEPLSAPATSQYLARREPGKGWSTEAISPPRSSTRLIGVTYTSASDFVAFSPDLCRGWLRFAFDPTLNPLAPDHYTGLYGSDQCDDGVYDPLNTTVPSNTESSAFIPELQGLSSDGTRAVFRANGKLMTAASNATEQGQGVYQLYERAGSVLRLVSALPSGKATDLNASAGTPSGASVTHRDQAVAGAVSRDATRVYWTAANGTRLASGPLYVRINADEPPSKVTAGECVEEGKACTLPVSETVGSGAAQFWAASADGSIAYFTIGDELYRFELSGDEGVATLVAGGMVGLLGAGEDASRAYFVSEQVLAAGATADSPNLYLLDDGSSRFIATLSSGDMPSDREVRSPVSPEPIMHTARVTPDALHLAFMSAGDLKGYDNADAASEEPDAEVYLYDANAAGGQGRLSCISCNRSAARPAGKVLEHANSGLPDLWAAAQISTSETQLYSERALSDDGGRLYFESFEALALADTNGRQDVYQWEAAGKGSCSAVSPDFDPKATGCVSLISSGTSAEDSEFLDASPSGADVFIATGSSLLPQDYGLVDVYDIRELGGLPAPATSPAACEGEACQGLPTPPNDPTPASATFQGAGNVREDDKPRCGRQKVRRRNRCVAKKPHKKQGKRRAQKRKGYGRSKRGGA